MTIRGGDYDPLRVTRGRAAIVFTALIALQVVYGVVTRTPIDVTVLGALGGLDLAVLGVGAAIKAANLLRGSGDATD